MYILADYISVYYVWFITVLSRCREAVSIEIQPLSHLQNDLAVEPFFVLNLMTWVTKDFLITPYLETPVITNLTTQVEIHLCNQQAIFCPRQPL